MDGRDSADVRPSHLLDLDQRLRGSGLHPADLAAPTIISDRNVTSRARAKFKADIPSGAYARTPAMVDLRADHLRRRSRFGHWPTFPSDPTVFYDKFRLTVEPQRMGHRTPDLQSGRRAPAATRRS